MCQLIQLENGATAFICNCGKSKDHKCNEDCSVLLLANGERVADTPENQEKYQNEIRGGSVCCSICGHAAIDDAYWM
jgi:hypothetical protein